MSRRLELKKAKSERVELVKVTSENIKEVANNIYDYITAYSDDNIWEAVNTMIPIETPVEVSECLYKMVSNKVGISNYCVSNPFVVEEIEKAFEEVACTGKGMSKIKAYLITKELDGGLIGVTYTPPRMVTDTHEIEVLVAKVEGGNDIHISRINDRYSAYRLTNFWNMRDKTENELIELLEREIG